MKVSELKGAELDYWVAICEGWKRAGKEWHTKPGHRKSKDYPGEIISDWGQKGPHDFLVSPWSDKDRIAYCGCESTTDIPRYSENWEDCGPLIEKYNIEISPAFNGHGGWYAEIKYGGTDVDAFYGNSAQQAICRAVVASVFGDKVDDKVNQE